MFFSNIGLIETIPISESAVVHFEVAGKKWTPHGPADLGPHR